MQRFHLEERCFDTEGFCYSRGESFIIGESFGNSYDDMVWFKFSQCHWARWWIGAVEPWRTWAFFAEGLDLARPATPAFVWQWLHFYADASHGSLLWVCGHLPTVATAVGRLLLRCCHRPGYFLCNVKGICLLGHGHRVVLRTHILAEVFFNSNDCFLTNPKPTS